MGEKEQKILKSVYATNAPIPEAIANAPTLEDGLGLYWWAFWELVTERSSGWGISPIPWSSIADFADAYDLDLETTETMFHHVRGMDKVYREHFEKQQARETKRRTK